MWIRKSKLKEAMAERYDQGLQIGFYLACTYLTKEYLPPEFAALYQDELRRLSPIMREVEQIVRNHSHKEV